MLAFDQRASFTAGLFGIEGTPSAEEVARIADSKRVIFEGLQLAVVDGAPMASAGLLVDEQFGSEVARAAKTGGYVLAMPVEKSGLAVFDFEYGAAFGEHIEAFDPTFAKVLVRYNPDGNAAMNLTQRTRLARLSSWLKEHGRQLLFELLVPAEPAQLSRVGGDRDRYDLEIRPELTVRSIAQFQAARVEPDIWKVEGLSRREDYVRVAQQAVSGGRDQVACIILGGGSSDARVEHWLRQEAGVPGFIGFAIGRTIWQQPLENWLARKLDRSAATRAIADNYLRMINVYQDARGRLAAVDLAADRGL
jgi:myo-inositol catabolism protein IolC